MPSCTIRIGVKTSKAVGDMFDMSQAMQEIVDLVPSYSKDEAEKLKTDILNKMCDWIIADPAYGYNDAEK